MGQSSSLRILFVTNGTGRGEVASRYFRAMAEGVEVTVLSADSNFRQGRRLEFDAIVVDTNPGEDRQALLEALKPVVGHVPVIDLVDGSPDGITLNAGTGLQGYFPPLEVDAIAYLRSLIHVLAHEDLQKEVASLKQKLIDLDPRDPQTGLWNRPYILERISELVTDWRRYKYPMTLCVFDLLDMDRITNDYGPEVSCEVIAEFGELIRQVKRSNDYAGRLGAEQFCIAFPSTPIQSALVGVERIRDAVEKTLFSGKTLENFTVGVAFGVAQVSEDYFTLEDVIERAQRMLERAKLTGASHIEVDWTASETQRALI